MPDILIGSDAQWVHDEVVQVLRGPDMTSRWVRSGPAVLDAVKAKAPDLCVLDLQIGSMGAFAVTLDLHLEAGIGRLPHVPVLVLLDRRADVFLCRRSEVEGWVLKPLDPIRLRKAITSLLAGGTYHDETFKPSTLEPEAASASGV